MALNVGKVIRHLVGEVGELGVFSFINESVRSFFKPPEKNIPQPQAIVDLTGITVNENGKGLFDETLVASDFDKLRLNYQLNGGVGMNGMTEAHLLDLETYLAELPKKQRLRFRLGMALIKNEDQRLRFYANMATMGDVINNSGITLTVKQQRDITLAKAGFFDPDYEDKIVSGVEAFLAACAARTVVTEAQIVVLHDYRQRQRDRSWWEKAIGRRV